MNDAWLFPSCAREEVTEVEESVPVIVRARSAVQEDAKTSLSGTHVFWSENDAVHPTDAEMEAIFAKAEADYTTLSESLFIESYVKILHKKPRFLPGSGAVFISATKIFAIQINFFRFVPSLLPPAECGRVSDANETIYSHWL